MEFYYQERLTAIAHYYELDRKGLYSGDNFWIRLSYILNNEPDLSDIPSFTWKEWKQHCNDIFDMGPTLKTFDERYFEEYGELYEDNDIPEPDDDIDLLPSDIEDYMTN